MIAFESPHRLLTTLDDLKEVLGDRRIAIARELTKIHEEVFRGRISEAIEHFKEPRGEFTMVIDGKAGVEKTTVTPEIMEDLSRLYRQGIGAKEAVAQLSLATGISKKQLYGAWLEIKNSISGTG